MGVQKCGSLEGSHSIAGLPRMLGTPGVCSQELAIMEFKLPVPRDTCQLAKYYCCND